MIGDVKLNQSWSTKPNPDYYEMGLDGKPLPYLNEVQYIIFADRAAEVAALRAGKLDMLRATGIESTDVPPLKQCCPELVYKIQNRFSNSSLWFNLQKAPWNDIRVRRATRLAINREDLISSLDGMAAHAGYMPPGFAEYLPPVEKLKELWKQDIPAGIKLMEEAGYGPNNRIKTTLVVGNFYAKQAEVVQQHLARIGIDTTIEVTEGGGSGWMTEHQKKERDLDLGWGNYGSNEAPGFWMGEIIRTGASQNKVSMSDPEIDRLGALQSVEANPEKRAALFRQIQDRMYEITPWVPTVSNYYHRFRHCRVQNGPWMQDNHNSYIVVTAWIDEAACKR
jgi:peptide/nickel transport system substrate-binding protein